jgi:hypothetical protein
MKKLRGMLPSRKEENNLSPSPLSNEQPQNLKMSGSDKGKRIEESLWSRKL